MEMKTRITNLLTTIETVSAYACENCSQWEPEENSNFTAEAFFHVINIMAQEAKGWAQITATPGQ